MPSQADRLLVALKNRVDVFERRLLLLEQRLDHVPDRVDNIEDQIATIEKRLTRAGFPRDMRPPDRRTPGQREADRFNAIIDGPDYVPPNLNEDDERGYRPPGFPVHDPRYPDVDPGTGDEAPTEPDDAA